jgi:monofunctional glycosyltransferase
VTQKAGAQTRPAWQRHGLRLAALVLLCTASLQLVWVVRVALMGWVDPASTAFQRSEAWRLLSTQGHVPWAQSWLDLPALGQPLQRAVLASEDAGFVDHNGVEWDAIQTAWQRNSKAQERAEKQAEKRTSASPKTNPAATRKPAPAPKVVGGSTVTQQLAKNLFLSGERTALRKAQELVITLALEALLPKARILEIYLNHVEWGEGVFGAEAAAQHYFGVAPARLSPEQAARLAVLLPAPKRYEKSPASSYVLARAGAVQARMAAVELP